MKKNIMGLFLGLVMLFCISVAFAGDIPVSVSEDGVYVLLTNANYKGLELFNSETGQLIKVTDGINAGYYAAISPGSNYVCFKAFQKQGQELLHAPMLFSIKDEKIIQLNDFSAAAGTPAVSIDGKIAYTVESILYVKLTDGKTISYDLGHHVNLIAFSPDGEQIAYNDSAEQIIIINIIDGIKTAVTDGSQGYWGPEFSPLGNMLFLKGINGDIIIADIKAKQIKKIGNGENPKWVDEETIGYVSKKIQGQDILESDLVVISAKGEIKGTTPLNTGNADAIINHKNIIVNKGGNIKTGFIGNGKAELLSDMNIPEGKGGETTSDVQIESVQNDGTVTEIIGVPVINQVYDTLDTHCGSSSCGATSALMAIQYYNILPANPYQVSTPYVHTSDYGFYISEIYTYNGHTYNIKGRDSCNQWAYGGYGYIIQNNWEDTKTHMAEYISYHGPASSVDWSPTFAKAQQEVYNGTPFVLLNSLTSAGHYICTIGYHNSQYTLVFNDPYGNKNLGTYPNFNGGRVFYDWPGYNYGNQNLNTVHCYIYCRMTTGPTPIPTASPTPSPTPAPGTNVVVDNDQGGTYYTETGTWTTSGSTGYNGTTYRFCYGGDAATATWNGSISESGNYNVYVMFLQSTNRVTAAKYIVHAAGGDQVAYVNQNGTQQVVEKLVGTYTFNAGTASITLDAAASTPAASAVIADAVRFTLVAVTPTPTPPPTPSPTPSPSPTPTPIPQVPNAPSNLTATVISKSQINLAWTDNSTNENNFVVERKKSSDSTYTVIATLAANTTTYNNTGLTRNTTYNYRVKAVNGGGSSAYSNVVTATTPSK